MEARAEGFAPTSEHVEPGFDDALGRERARDRLHEHGLLDLAPTLLPLIASAQSPLPDDAEHFPNEMIGALRRDDKASAESPASTAVLPDRLVLERRHRAGSTRQRIAREQVGREALAACLNRLPVKFDMPRGLPTRRPELRDRNPRADDFHPGGRRLSRPDENAYFRTATAP